MLTVSIFCGPILVVTSVRGASIFEPPVRLLHLEAVCSYRGGDTAQHVRITGSGAYAKQLYRCTW